MPRWDRPRGGGDSGGDEPPVPGPPRYEHPAAERPVHGSEGAGASGDAGDGHPRRPRDTSRETGRQADSAWQYQTLFDRQGEIIDAQKQRIGMLTDDVSKLENRVGKLEDRNDKLLERNDKLRAENDQLRAELAKKNDKPSEGQTAVEKSPYATPREAKPTSTPDRPWYRKWPSEKVVGGATALVGLGEAIAAGTHHLSGGDQGIITAAIGAGVAGYGIAREAHKERQERKADNADQPED